MSNYEISNDDFSAASFAFGIFHASSLSQETSGCNIPNKGYRTLFLLHIKGMSET